MQPAQRVLRAGLLLFDIQFQLTDGARRCLNCRRRAPFPDSAARRCSTVCARVLPSPQDLPRASSVQSARWARWRMRVACRHRNYRAGFPVRDRPPILPAVPLQVQLAMALRPQSPSCGARVVVWIVLSFRPNFVSFRHDVAIPSLRAFLPVRYYFARSLHAKQMCRQRRHFVDALTYRWYSFFNNACFPHFFNSSRRIHMVQSCSIFTKTNEPRHRCRGSQNAMKNKPRFNLLAAPADSL